MYNVSVKIKRRESAEAGKRMPLYVQIIYRRKVRKIQSKYPAILFVIGWKNSVRFGNS